MKNEITHSKDNWTFEVQGYKRMVVLYVPTALLSEQPTDKINFNMMDWLTD